MASWAASAISSSSELASSARIVPASMGRIVETAPMAASTNGFGAYFRAIIIFMASLPTEPLTEEQYLRIEREAETKSEFYEGQMFAMAGASPNHALLTNNIGAVLYRQMPPGCLTFNADLRIKVQSAGLYTYADCSVICGELEYAGDQRDVILNPLLIVEVLSPSTEGYDRGKKFQLYRTIESFREYLIVHQDGQHVEHYSRQDDDSWLLREHIGADASVSIEPLNAQIPLAELYASALNVN
jgi:Uma2 family endonuclease